MNITGRFSEAILEIDKITIPSCLVDGKITKSFQLKVLQVDEDQIQCEGKLIEYHFVNERKDLTKILDSASKRQVTTLLIHTQFLPVDATDEELLDIARKGYYNMDYEHWAGDMVVKLIEVYSLAQAGKWEQFEDYNYEQI